VGKVDLTIELSELMLRDESQDQILKKTVLHSTHVESNAKMVPFGGWDMPVQYANGIIAEINAVRNVAGIFDVSHMGRFEFEGEGAESFLSTFLSANLPVLKIGRGKYNFICNEHGGIIDDAMVYRTGDQSFLLVINAGNAEVDMEWINPLVAKSTGFSMNVVTNETAMIAIQGPKAVEIMVGRTVKHPIFGDSELAVRRSLASLPRLREPVTQAKTDSKSSCLPIRARNCGTCFAKRVR
jgi:glycine cleavage system aminomethyltransferase T